MAERPASRSVEVRQVFSWLRNLSWAQLSADCTITTCACARAKFVSASIWRRSFSGEIMSARRASLKALTAGVSEFKVDIPSTKALREDLDLPSRVRGPELIFALRRLAFTRAVGRRAPTTTTQACSRRKRGRLRRAGRGGARPCLEALHGAFRLPQARRL